MRNPAPPREIPYQDSLSRKWRDMASPCLGAGGRGTQMHTHIHTCIHTHVPCVGLAPRTLQILEKNPWIGENVRKDSNRKLE